MSDVRELKFEPGAMTIVQMGEELIGHPSTAINELVKNSYDADADKCWVYTQYDKDPNKNFIIIKDNGLGMDSKTLFGNWLKPSISGKRDEDREKRKSLIYERRFLGSKGIGRLASMALGQILTIVTKKKEDSEYNWLRIDREEFKTEGLLNEVSFPGGAIFDFINLFNSPLFLERFNLRPNGVLINLLQEPPLSGFDEGTIIILQNLDDSVKTIIEEEFAVKEIDETTFYKSLRDLITPLKLNSEIQEELVKEGILDKSLKIDNGSGSFELFYGVNFIKEKYKKQIAFIPVESAKILNFFDYRIVGKVTTGYEVVGKYICRRLESDIKEEKINLEQSFVLSAESISVRELDFDDGPVDVVVGEYYFDFRIYDLDDESKENMMVLLNAKGRREASQIFSKYLGVKITKNGFGIKPYGEEGQDWLGLGAKRVNKHIVSIGPNQIIGYTFLYSPQNDALNEKTNREGFFENKAFIYFKKTIGAILEEVGRKRASYRLSHNLGRRAKSKLDRPDSERFIEYILKSSNDNALINRTKEYVAETNSALDNMQDTLTFSQRLASLGTGLELIFHELAQPINSIGGAIDSLINNIKSVHDDELRQKFNKRAQTIKSSVQALDILKESLKPAIGKSLPKEFLVLDTFKKVCHLFEYQFSEANIRLEIQKSILDKKVKTSEYIFWVAFLNIINNFVYWLQFSGQEKIIMFQFQDPSTFIISNTGPQILFNDDIDEIFEYGITSKKERNATGLGLSFTRSLLSSIDWEIWAENKAYGPAFYIKKQIKND